MAGDGVVTLWDVRIGSHALGCTASVRPHPSLLQSASIIDSRLSERSFRNRQLSLNAPLTRLDSRTPDFWFE